MKLPSKLEDQYVKEVLYNTSLKNLPKEKWKVIKDFDNYAISNYGRIKILENWKGYSYGNGQKEPERIMKLTFKKYFNKYLNRSFYLVDCGLSLNGMRYTKSVARLVYYHFIEEFNMDDRSIVISYKDSNGLHLNYKNLEKLSIKERTIKAIQNNRAKNRIIEYQKPVKQYTVDGKLVATFESIYAADKALGFGCRNILYILQEKFFTAGGFRWFWKDYIPTKEDFVNPKKNKISSIKIKRLTSNILFNNSLWEKLDKLPIDENSPPACLNLSLEDLPDEHWKPIPRFENQYVISDKGRVKRLSGWTSDNNIFFGEEQIMTLNVMDKSGDKSGYLYIRLNRREKRTLLIIPRLLYYCFTEQFDLNDRTLVIDNQNDPMWDMDVSKLSLRSISSLLNQKRLSLKK